MFEKIGPGHILVIEGRRYLVLSRARNDGVALQPVGGDAPQIFGLGVLAGLLAEGSLEIERPHASPPDDALRVDRPHAASAVTTP